jgi:hypothetical protein
MTSNSVAGRPCPSSSRRLSMQRCLAATAISKSSNILRVLERIFPVLTTGGNYVFRDDSGILLSCKFAISAFSE